MANIKISELPAINSLTGTEVFPVVQSGTTSQITSANLQVYLATDTYVRNHANAAFNTANAATATNTTQNNSIASAFVHANAAFANANSYITYNEAISVTQNNSIASAFVHANAAFTAANNTTSKNTSSWTVATGINTYSITVPINNAYQIWVRANIPNGIISYIATVHVTNTNVPVLGSQRAWNYTGGGSPILLTTMPTQIVGTEGAISTTEVSTTTANRFDFVINNSSGSSQTVSWGYVTLS